MKLKTSFCNGTLIRKGLVRGLPLWGSYLLLMLLALPMNLLSELNFLEDPVNIQRSILASAVSLSSAIPFFYGLAAACVLFSWLYRSRSANFFGALPLSRTKLFLTNYLTGLLYALLPNLLVVLVSALIVMPISPALLTDLLLWLLAATMGYVFYYSFAVFCAMIVGHTVALPALYVILNFTVVVVEVIIRELMTVFVYGISYIYEPTLTCLSPMVHQLSNAGLDVRTVWGFGDQVTGFRLENWSYLIILTAAGILLAGIACLLHKHRRLEAAGDVIAVKQLRPVFLYCFTAGCSLVLGWILASYLMGDAVYRTFIPMLLCMLIGAFLGFFVGQMLLQKSLRVFRKKNWLRCAASCGVIVLVMFCFRFDLFGIAGYVPDADEIASVSVGYYDAHMTDPRFIGLVTEFHQDIIDRQDETERMNDHADRTPGVTIFYRLKNGSSVTRQYDLPLTKATAADPDSLIRQYEAIMNHPDYIVVRELPDDLAPDSLLRGHLFYDSDSGKKEIYLTGEQVYLLLHEGLIPDLRAGRTGTILHTDRYDHKDAVPVETTPYAELRIEHKDGVYYHLTIPASAVSTVQFLDTNGLLSADYFR